MPKIKDSGKSGSKKPAREVQYESITSDVCQGETSITADDARQLLGWEDAPEGDDGYVREIARLTGGKTKAKCTNNTANRPIYLKNLAMLKQEILRGRWRCNGEPIIIGRTGLLLNGQHTLIALVLANLDWETDKEQWAEYWTSPPTIEKVVVSGVGEDDETVNTMDTCKPRTLGDVFYRTESFSGFRDGQRKVIGRMANHAIRLLWHRTGVKLDAFSLKMTHAEALDFLDRHPKLMDCLKHIYEENGDEQRLKPYVSLGYAAGLLYLMGSSSTDPSAYRLAAHPSEDQLDWDRWDQACDFFVQLAAGGGRLKAVRTAIADTFQAGGKISNPERWAILSNAWLAVINDDPVDDTALTLEYDTTDASRRVLAEHPSVGGIDLGDPSTVDESALVMRDPTPEEIEQAKEETRRGKAPNRKDDEPKPKPSRLGPPRKAGLHWAKDDVAWVHDTDGEHFLGLLTEDPWDCDDHECRVVVRTAKGQEWEVKYDDLSLDKPKGEKNKAGEPEIKGEIKVKQVRKPKVIGWDIGQLAWVDRDGEPWQGRIVDLTKTAAKLRVEPGHQGAGSVRAVGIAELLRQQPV